MGYVGLSAKNDIKINATSDLELTSDNTTIKFGADDDVTITHDPDDGLIFKSIATADDNPFLLTIQTGETDLAANDVIGKIQFQAPDEGTGTDAVLVSAAIQAVSEGDFSSSSNATRLEFMTGASEAATAKMTLSSAGVLDVDGGITVDNITIDGTEIDLSSGDLTIDVEGDITLDANGGNIFFKDNGTEFLEFEQDGGGCTIRVDAANTDLKFVGNDSDGGGTITALTLDMSAAGAATFNSTINGVGISYNISNFSESMLISNDAGTGTLSTASNNTGFGHEVFDDLTSGDGNTAMGHEAGDALTSGSLNTFIGSNAGGAAQTVNNNTAIGAYAFDAGTGADNTAVGSGALGGASNSGANNTAVGYDAGNSISSGLQNTLIGSKASDALTVGHNNTVIGFDALHSDTQGSNSVAIGSFALYYQNFTSATTALNVAVGNNAGEDITTGINNTLVGANAGKDLTDADFNTALGTHALYDDANGSKSTALGYYTLGSQSYGSATDSHNTAVGYHAGLNVTTGKKNTFVGSLAGDATDDGDDNTCMGYQAGTANLGNQNTFVGAYAGLVCTGAENTGFGHGAGESITSGSNNVCIGHDAGSNQVSTGDNLLYIARNGNAAGNDGCWIHGTATGTCINGDNSTAWAQTSDRRIKKNIADSSVGLTEINKLKIRNFEYRTFEELDSDVKALNNGKGLNVISKSGTKTGIIAQEVEEVFPNDVHEMGDGTKIVTPSDLNYALIKAVQELSAKVTSLEAEVTKLKGE